MHLAFESILIALSRSKRWCSETSMVHKKMSVDIPLNGLKDSQVCKNQIEITRRYFKFRLQNFYPYTQISHFASTPA